MLQLQQISARPLYLRSVCPTVVATKQTACLCIPGRACCRQDSASLRAVATELAKFLYQTPRWACWSRLTTTQPTTAKLLQTQLYSRVVLSCLLTTRSTTQAMSNDNTTTPLSNPWSIFPNTVTRQDRLTTPSSCCLGKCSGACWAWHRRKTPLHTSQTTPHVCPIHPNVAKKMPTTSHSQRPQHISHPSISGTRAASRVLPPKKPIPCTSTQYPDRPYTRVTPSTHRHRAKRQDRAEACGRHASEHIIRVLLGSMCSRHASVYNIRVLSKNILSVQASSHAILFCWMKPRHTQTPRLKSSRCSRHASSLIFVFY